MQLGMVGLGRMGSNLVRRLMRDGHELVVYDLDEAVVEQAAAEGARAARSLEEMADALAPPRAVWIMVPAGVTGAVINDVSVVLAAGDVVIDGGNSYYQDDMDRAAELESSGITFIDVGTSGGVYGLDRGFCLMIGGDRATVERLDPIFRTLAPGMDAAPRTPDRTGPPAPAEFGYFHCGPAGAGHFVKMVHNGIEYGMMAAIAEGLNILRHADIGTAEHQADAETAPLRDPEHYQYDFAIPEIAEVWRRGSVVSSWLVDLTANALAASPELIEYEGMVSDSGEGRWTILSAVAEGVPAPVLSAALYGRFDSRGRDDFANQVLSAMRDQFGGHKEKPR
ncbi:MAG: decarboxylating 6-phosphogluconate dehydrogenase [Acidimicrobiia bacterium]|nr:decarboxylating 6-phosphogluconate dehydrogenase [Acidimicrobiia bacterium]MDH4307549.1 decarboxylating 6-phosphogluconate dehydrogenase [Acidimicrobiia bacterium]